MNIVGESLDDLLIKTYKKLLSKKAEFVNSVKATKGENREILGATLHLKDPRARVSRSETKGTIFSCLGELLWYLAGEDQLEFIEYYIEKYSQFAEENLVIHGAYGPRIFRGPQNQFDIVRNKLKSHDGTRKAVIQIFDAKDLLRSYKDVPCTCCLQFFVRNSKLDLIVFMRSSDAFMGLPHDIFAFTMIQEVMARSIGCDIGTYRHMAGSLHLYDKNFQSAKRYIEEGYQSNMPMPIMPVGDPWPSIKKVLDLEEKIRRGERILIPDDLDRYWSDLVRVLLFYSNSKAKRRTKRNVEMAESIISTISFPEVYNIYLETRKRKDSKKINTLDQPELDFFDFINGEKNEI
ncbi:thymidylate synthase [Chromobacterium sp. IIBBL 290-4]|uniref:thymidylate synthase n=1 Tax=Chromobacterium sp. IIBBL 290-4 TaxID=2953890 RepID=UPI0020B6E5D8|nr:thymidylate synthase [Chromobacterium sp. IIBBL 290-4]UTH75680.1 thymidylate synthase [Chromobacterium sp. IIBBL 290-4]